MKDKFDCPCHKNDEVVIEFFKLFASAQISKELLGWILEYIVSGKIPEGMTKEMTSLFQTLEKQIFPSTLKELEHYALTKEDIPLLSLGRKKELSMHSHPKHLEDSDLFHYFKATAKPIDVDRQEDLYNILDNQGNFLWE